MIPLFLPSAPLISQKDHRGRPIHYIWFLSISWRLTADYSALEETTNSLYFKKIFKCGLIFNENIYLQLDHVHICTATAYKSNLAGGMSKLLLFLLPPPLYFFNIHINQIFRNETEVTNGELPCRIAKEYQMTEGHPLNVTSLAYISTSCKSILSRTTLVKGQTCTCFSECK